MNHCSPDKNKPPVGSEGSLLAAKRIFRGARKVLVGIGAGVSSSGGLDYMDPSLVTRWYPEYAAIGLTNILEIQSRFWWLHKCKPEEYWAFWARHFYHIRYEPDVLEPYALLKKLLDGKEYFICSTNVDGQLEKAGCDSDRIFAPQGDYALFQCCRPCHDDVYDNKDMIERMVNNMPDPCHIRSEDIPLCPKCGAFLVPNLRSDHTFVERPHLANYPAYTSFLQGCQETETAILEMGVGYNTPGIIRFPFENLTRNLPHCRLLRVNTEESDIPQDIQEKSLSFAMDITLWLRAQTADKDQ